jgi:hypothetical protein
MPTRFVLAILSVTALAGLAGCISPDELRSQDQAACSRYGVKPDSPDFASCMQWHAQTPRYAYSPFGPTEGHADPGWNYVPGWDPRATWQVLW